MIKKVKKNKNDFKNYFKFKDKLHSFKELPF